MHLQIEIPFKGNNSNTLPFKFFYCTLQLGSYTEVADLTVQPPVPLKSEGRRLYTGCQFISYQKHIFGVFSKVLLLLP